MSTNRSKKQNALVWTFYTYILLGLFLAALAYLTDSIGLATIVLVMYMGLLPLAIFIGFLYLLEIFK